MKNISVIIRNKNESRWIGYSIQSCLDFFENPEIIVVDNKSSDNSMEIVRSFKHDPHLEPSIRNYCDVKVTNIDSYTPGKSLNKGIKLASKPYICILSAHAVIKNLDSEHISKKLEEYQCIFGKQIPVYRGKRITPRYLWSHFSDKEVKNMFSQLESRYFMHNAFSIFPRKTLLEIPFNEEVTGKEDRLWAKELISKNKNFLYTPRMVAEHYYTKDGNTWKGVG